MIPNVNWQRLTEDMRDFLGMAEMGPSSIRVTHEPGEVTLTIV